MTPRRVDRTQECVPAQAQVRLRQAEPYLEVASMVLGSEPGEEATVATGNAVLAGIAASDAICCVLAAIRYRGSNHRQAADLLEQVTGDRTVAATLRSLIDLKDGAHYGLGNVRVKRAKSSVRKAGSLVDVARGIVAPDA